MKLAKKYIDAISFARTCTNEKIDPLEMAELATLVMRAYRAGVKECNIVDYNADKLRDTAEAYATKMGFTTQWPGLLPLFYREDGTRVCLKYL